MFPGLSLHSILMEPEPCNSTSNATKKMKYAPKAPPLRKPKPEVKTEIVENANADAAQAMDLLQRFNQGAVKERPKVEKKATFPQEVFLPPSASSHSASTSINAPPSTLPPMVTSQGAVPDFEDLQHLTCDDSSQNFFSLSQQWPQYFSADCARHIENSDSCDAMISLYRQRQ